MEHYYFNQFASNLSLHKSLQLNSPIVCVYESIRMPHYYTAVPGDKTFDNTSIKIIMILWYHYVLLWRVPNFFNTPLACTNWPSLHCCRSLIFNWVIWNLLPQSYKNGSESGQENCKEDKWTGLDKAYIATLENSLVWTTNSHCTFVDGSNNSKIWQDLPALDA